jgi:diguanylate cyclase (GGDEF)-like protein
MWKHNEYYKESEMDKIPVKPNNADFVDNDTGLYNRSYFEDRIQQEIYRAERYRHYLSLAVIYILDKNGNSHETHLDMKEHMKNLFTTLLKECKRRMDVACQFEDNSLFILLPETQSEDAEKVALRIKKTFEDYLTANPFGHQKSISARVCTYPSNARTSKELIEKTLNPIKSLN